MWLVRDDFFCVIFIDFKGWSLYVVSKNVIIKIVFKDIKRFIMFMLWNLENWYLELK